jgi:hypothetical protein
MYQTQQVQGPVAPAQYGAMQVAGPTAYLPLQTDTWTGMFSMMMPMLMFVLMFALITPLFKGITRTATE